jgi:hypothetical protein
MKVPESPSRTALHDIQASTTLHAHDVAPVGNSCAELQSPGVRCAKQLHA